jgi:hypothetical protein
MSQDDIRTPSTDEQAFAAQIVSIRNDVAWWKQNFSVQTQDVLHIRPDQPGAPLEYQEQRDAKATSRGRYAELSSAEALLLAAHSTSIRIPTGGAPSPAPSSMPTAPRRSRSMRSF